MNCNFILFCFKFLWNYKTICLHLKWYSSSQLPLHNPTLTPYHPSPLPSPLPVWECSSTNPLSPVPPLQHPPRLGHQPFTGTRTCPPIDVRQGHPLLHMYLESWISPCTQNTDTEEYYVQAWCTDAYYNICELWMYFLSKICYFRMPTFVWIFWQPIEVELCYNLPETLRRKHAKCISSRHGASCRWNKIFTKKLFVMFTRLSIA